MSVLKNDREVFRPELEFSKEELEEMEKESRRRAERQRENERFFVREEDGQLRIAV